MHAPLIATPRYERLTSAGWVGLAGPLDQITHRQSTSSSTLQSKYISKYFLTPFMDFSLPTCTFIEFVPYKCILFICLFIPRGKE